jgi:glutathione S-transferase
MCIKELGIDVDMRHIDMYKKAEHTQPWFVKVSACNQFRRSYFPPL